MHGRLSRRAEDGDLDVQHYPPAAGHFEGLSDRFTIAHPVAGLIPNPDVVVREVGTEIVIVHLGRNEIFTTNQTGARIWALIGEGVPETEITGRLLEEFQESDREVVAQETQDFLGLLHDEGLVTRAGA